MYHPVARLFTRVAIATGVITVAFSGVGATPPHPVLAAPPQPTGRLIIQQQGQFHVEQGVTFWITNGVTPAPKHLVSFDLRLHGAWGRPALITIDATEACNGDTIPRLRSIGSSLWTLDFGDCGTVALVLVPTKPGRYSLTIRTFNVPLTSTGLPAREHKSPVPSMAFHWNHTTRP